MPKQTMDFTMSISGEVLSLKENLIFFTCQKVKEKVDLILRFLFITRKRKQNWG